MHHQTQSFRLHSLDAFRGITIAGMLFVNTASLSPSLPAWLAHSYWNGCTLADCVFPFFLFIVGVTTAFSLSKYNQGKKPTWALYGRILRRSILLFALGLMVNAFLSNGLGSIKLTGVLERISLAYLATALIALNLPRKAQWSITVLLLLGYWAAYHAFPVPEPEYKPGDPMHQDVAAFGVMSGFGMMTTIAITLMGYFTGSWLQTELVIKKICTSKQSLTLAMFGLSSSILGLLWNLVLPINKKLWTSSYVMFTVGLALLLLAVCYELIEVREKKRWSHPMQVLGLNSLLIFIGSELLIKILEKSYMDAGNRAISNYEWVDKHLFLNWFDPNTAGILFALSTLLLWWILAYFLYWRRFFVAV